MRFNKISLVLFIAIFPLLFSCKPSKKVLSDNSEVPINNPIPVKFGDPFLLKASDGIYYLYGTSLADGFECFVSADLQTWDSCGQVYKGGKEGMWNKDCFWAPEVYERNGKYYMFYSANINDSLNVNNELETFNIGVAVSDSPKGPFKDLFNRPIFNPGYPIIDANVYFDDSNGKCYLYFSRCCYKHAVESEIAEKMKAENKQYETVEGDKDKIEESWVYGVELKSDFSGVVGEPRLLLCPPKKLSDAQAEWESRSVTSGEVNRRWTEGSYIFKEGDTYYIMYSANFYKGPYYAVGYATSKNPLGPFTKADNNPVLQKNTDKGGTVTGTGHNMVIKIGNQRYIVYHAYTTADPDNRVVMMDKLDLKDGKIMTVAPTIGK